MDKKELTIEYCPTEYILAHISTKSLQGSLFQYFRDVIMGYRNIFLLFSLQCFESMECIEILNKIPNSNNLLSTNGHADPNIQEIGENDNLHNFSNFLLTKNMKSNDNKYI